MAKFCVKCGARLDEATGKCPNCDGLKTRASVDEQGGTSAKKGEKESRKEKKSRKKAAGQGKGKLRGILCKSLLIILLLVVLAAGTATALVYFGVADIPAISDFLERVGVLESDRVTPPDADEFFETNSNVVTVIDVNDSTEVLTESEVCDTLVERGFTQYSVTTEYSMDGDYSEAAEVSDASGTKHPIYQTYYVTAGGDIWTIFVINGAIMANPVSYNLQSELGVQVIFSERETVTSYDSTTNQFYETIPNESALIVKTVSRINAEILEGLTVEEIDDYGK